MTKPLQTRNMDVIGGLELIQTLKNVCINLRNNINSNHNSWYREAAELANQIVNESQPRTTGRQTFRGNPPADSISE